MYPFFRLLKDSYRARSQPRLGLFETHVSHHLCLPWDLDPWNELNNGRTLTIYDLGRIPFAQRTGLVAVLRAQGWVLTVAGSVVRYRRRVRLFDRIEIRSRFLGWDRRFSYIDQSMWRSDGECSSHAVFRTAMTDRNGIVAPERVIAAMNHEGPSPALPDWVQAWCAAEDQRPWPPQAG
jgi:acyl-CoA thioesterase FadM